MEFFNKTAIITGASRGIGRNIAKSLAKLGINVIANYNKSEKQAKELQEELKKENINIDIFKADVSKREEAKEMIKFVQKKYNKIDILINNAGISEYKLFTEETDEDWQRVINTNLYSAFVMCQEVVPSMIKQKNGVIINISAIWGMVGASLEVIYSISKAGLDGLTKSLAKELAPCNIRVNSISPGIINTQMNQNLSEKEIDNLKEEIPLQKIGNPQDISRCVEWLIKDEYTTGQIISINGGWVIT